MVGSLVLGALMGMGTENGLAQDFAISGSAHRNYCSLDLKVKALLAQSPVSSATPYLAFPLRSYLRVDGPRPYPCIG